MFEEKKKWNKFLNSVLTQPTITENNHLGFASRNEYETLSTNIEKIKSSSNPNYGYTESNNPKVVKKATSKVDDIINDFLDKVKRRNFNTPHVVKPESPDLTLFNHPKRQKHSPSAFYSQMRQNPSQENTNYPNINIFTPEIDAKPKDIINKYPPQSYYTQKNLYSNMSPLNNHSDSIHQENNEYPWKKFFISHKAKQTMNNPMTFSKSYGMSNLNNNKQFDNKMDTDNFQNVYTQPSTSSFIPKPFNNNTKANLNCISPIYYDNDLSYQYNQTNQRQQSRTSPSNYYEKPRNNYSNFICSAPKAFSTPIKNNQLQRSVFEINNLNNYKNTKNVSVTTQTSCNHPCYLCMNSSSHHNEFIVNENSFYYTDINHGDLAKPSTSKYNNYLFEE